MKKFIKELKAAIESEIKRIKSNDLYPAYCLNVHVDGLEQAIKLIDEIYEEYKKK